MPLALRLIAVSALAVWGGAALAQPNPCPDALAEGERLYQERDYAAVEPAVSACIYSGEAGPAEVQGAYRLVALALIRQGQLPEARLAVVSLLGLGFDYQPDPVYDPPSYVSLVTAVKGQLRVEAERGGAAVDLNTADEAALTRVPGLSPALARRIVATRDALGPFATLGDLVVVEGVTPRLVERIAGGLAVGRDGL